jgi:hypothetical protein
MENSVYKRTTHAITFWCIVVSAVLFRAPDLQTDAIFLSQLARPDWMCFDALQQMGLGDYNQIAVCFCCIAVMLIGPLAVNLYQKLFLPTPYWVKIHAATAVALLCWIFSATTRPAFIYFQF